MFQREQPSYSLGNFQFQQQNFSQSMPMPSTNFALNTNTALPAQHFNLLDPQQYNFNSTLASQNRNSFFSHPEFKQANPSAIAPDLALDTSVTLLKDQVPTLEKAAFVLNTAKAGQNLAANIQKDLDDGKDVTETIVCKTLNTLTDNGLTTLGTGAIVGGIPLYLAAAVENPLLATTIPAVGTLIPHAYQNVTTAAQIAGNAVEQTCHDGFDMARRISMGGTK